MLLKHLPSTHFLISTARRLCYLPGGQGPDPFGHAYLLVHQDFLTMLTFVLLLQRLAGVDVPPGSFCNMPRLKQVNAEKEVCSHALDQRCLHFHACKVGTAVLRPHRSLTIRLGNLLKNAAPTSTLSVSAQTSSRLLQMLSGTRVSKRQSLMSWPLSTDPVVSGTSM